jgi:hypothetical protein
MLYLQQNLPDRAVTVAVIPFEYSYIFIHFSGELQAQEVIERPMMRESSEYLIN